MELLIKFLIQKLMRFRYKNLFVAKKCGVKSIAIWYKNNSMQLIVSSKYSIYLSELLVFPGPALLKNKDACFSQSGTLALVVLVT